MVQNKNKTNKHYYLPQGVHSPGKIISKETVMTQRVRDKHRELEKLWPQI